MRTAYEGKPDLDDEYSLAPVKTYGNGLENGYVNCEIEAGTCFSMHEMAERSAKTAPYMPEPVEGGFIPRNNIYERI
jgi:hypothetical protein